MNNPMKRIMKRKLEKKRPNMPWNCNFKKKWVQNIYFKRIMCTKRISLRPWV